MTGASGSLFDNVPVDAPLFLLGMPRSGTTWLSQIFDSSMDFAVRLSPNYSYSLKNSIGLASSREDWLAQLSAALISADPLITLNYLRDSGQIERFEKPVSLARILAVKDTRFHDIFMRGMEVLPAAKCIYIVRSPCGALNSWRKCKEFPDWADFAAEWRAGACRKIEGPGEYWGFDDWINLTAGYLAREAEAPGRFLVVRYEDLVRSPVAVTKRMFAFAGSEMSQGVTDFLARSHARHDDRVNSVFKNPAVADSWRSELPAEIRKTIEHELRGTPLERFV